MDSMLRPVARIVHRTAQLHCDLGWIDADVLACLPEAAGPTPDVAEEAAVKLDRKVVGENVPAPHPSQPAQPRCDICLLEFVQFALIGDVPVLQPAKLVPIERRRAFGIIELDRPA
jgi:hypothetical protein